MSEEVDTLPAYEIDDRKLHVFEGTPSVTATNGGVISAKTVDRYDVDQKIGQWESILSRIDSEMSRMQSQRMDIKYRLGHLDLLRRRVDVVAPWLQEQAR